MSANSASPSPSPPGRVNPSSDSSPRDQENVAAQRSLREASVVLEVAYNRIRQVRRNLLQLSETSPISEENTSRSVIDHYNIRPAHEALVLSGDELEERNAPEVGRARSPPFGSTSSSQSLSQRRGEAGDTGDPLFPARTLSDTTPSSERPAFFQLRQSSESSTRPPRLRSRRGTSPSDVRSMSRRASSPDPASTTRGLRVAAREALNQDSNLDFLANAAEFDLLLARQRERMADSVHALAAFRAQRAERNNRLLRAIETQDTQSTVPPLPPTISSMPWRPPDPRRWRIRPDLRTRNLRQSNLEITDQTATLSGILNRRPSSSDAAHSLQSSERGTAFHPWGRTPVSNDETLFLEDRSSNMTMDWSDEEYISWLFTDQDGQLERDFPARPLADGSANADAIRVTRTTDTTVSPLENSPPRRGWARLDPDGNEISSIEEEELERTRTEYRLRALHQTRRGQAGRVGTFGGLSQHNGSRAIYGSVLDSTLNVPEGSQNSIPPNRDDFTELYVDPLPMPLAAMMADTETRQGNSIDVNIVVPQHACLAGR